MALTMRWPTSVKRQIAANRARWAAQTTPRIATPKATTARAPRAPDCETWGRAKLDAAYAKDPANPHILANLELLDRAVRPR